MARSTHGSIAMDNAIMNHMISVRLFLEGAIDVGWTFTFTVTCPKGSAYLAF